MNYIAPDTDIYLLHGVRLDNTYEHTIYFTSAAAQYNWFAGKVKYNLTDYNYQRPEGELYVGIKEDDLYDCNYLMFRNTAFGNRWFYAFITNVRYVNNTTSAIKFEIDVMQTWAFDYVIEKSWIVREHSRQDIEGDNIEAEDLDIGPFAYTSWSRIAPDNDLSNIVFLTTFNEQWQPAVGSWLGGLYSGLQVFNFRTVTDANTFLNNTIAQMRTLDGIIACYMIPDDFMPVGAALPTGQKSYSKPTAVGSYTPRNKKLLTYPYNCTVVSTFDGQEVIFRNEFWSGNIKFQYIGDGSPNPTIFLTPQDYNGTDGFNYKLVLNGYPLCPFNCDIYKVWIAQNSIKTGLPIIDDNISPEAWANTSYWSDRLLKLVGTLISAAAGGAAGAASGSAAAAGGAAGAGAALLPQTGGVLGAIAQKQVLEAAPPQARNTGGSGGLFAVNRKGFYKATRYIKSQYAEKIDEYFDMYGYAVNRLKMPNIGLRPHWNYVKTAQVNIHGSLPFNDITKIKSNFNNGITFWKNGDEIGNYSLNNRPV